MKTGLAIFLGITLGCNVMGLAQESRSLTPAAKIVEALDQEILIPKGMTAKSAKIRAREIRRIDIEAIEFRLDSTELANSQSGEQVRLLAEALKDPRLVHAVVSLVGHASADGDDAHNQDLSQRRSEAIRTLLIRDYEIPERCLAARGKGESAPLPGLPRDSPKNRRVEVIREE
jgi:outer membrane protein OmpA-like peptidoglycan-associated protein